MGKVIDIKPDSLNYVKDDKGEFIGVNDSEIHFVNIESEKGVLISGGYIEKKKFMGLCIAWLSLNYPDVIKYDD